MAKKENSESYEVIAPSTDDAFLYHIFFQLLALPIALKNEKIREEHLANATAKVIHTHALDGKVYAIAGEVRSEKLENPVLNGYLTKKFDEVITEDNIPKLAKTWVEGLREAGVYGVSEEEVEQYMRKARELAKKIKEHVHGDRVRPEDIGTEYPLIHMALDVKEFRQFLAEISGKKIEPKKPKSPAVKGAVGPKKGTPETLKLEAQKLLGILNGLKYAGYSKEAVGSAVEDMLKRTEELAEKGELEVLALYLWTAHLLREGRFEDAEKFLKKES